jgi:solute carrier family 35, member F1/2
MHAVVKSYQYTSLTSVMLLDCWSIPCVILLTWVFLKTKYGARKFLGVGVCVLGLILVVFSDVHASDRASKRPVLSSLPPSLLDSDISSFCRRA